jgi:hypothetical protein
MITFSPILPSQKTNYAIGWGNFWTQQSECVPNIFYSKKIPSLAITSWKDHKVQIGVTT